MKTNKFGPCSWTHLTVALAMLAGASAAWAQTAGAASPIPRDAFARPLAPAGTVSQADGASAAGTPAATSFPKIKPWTDKAFVSVGLGIQFSHQTVNTGFVFPLYEETAIVSSSRGVDGGKFFDVTGGLRILGNIAVGFNFYSRSANGPGVFAASVPDPLFFDSARLTNGAMQGMKHKETSFTPLFVYVMPLRDRIDLMVSVGPSIVLVKHDVVIDASVTETGAAPQVAVTLGPVSQTVVGFQVGGDVRYMLTKRLGVGGGFRFARATADLTNGVQMKLGGPQVTIGARLRF